MCTNGPYLGGQSSQFYIPVTKLFFLWQPAVIGLKGFHHGLINYIDTKANVKGLCGYLSALPSYDPIPPLHTLYVHIYLFTQGGGGGELTREKVEGQLLAKLSSKYQQELLYHQSINSDKQLPQSPFTYQFFRGRHLTLVSI